MSKKLLIREVFEKGKRESGKDSKNGIAVYLWSYFEDKMNFDISDKTLVRYNDAFLRDNKDVNIEPLILDKLSQFLEFKDFADFCKNENFTKRNEDSSFTKVNVLFDNEDKSFTEKLSQIVVNITTTPIFKFPEFLTKQSNLGIIGAILCGGLFVGNKMYKADERTPEIINNGNRLGLLAATKQCMYWNGKEYVAEDCGQPKDDLIAIDPKKIANFKKITKPDTISSVRGIWYSKYQNEVEFFTADGINPENGKSLNPLTDHILGKYTNKE